MNNWNIPDRLEKEIRARDKNCIYCGILFCSGSKSRKGKATWEHIINDAEIINRENIALCCFSCNASKGNKTLAEWIGSDYCKRHGINRDTIAEVARKALDKQL